MAHFSTPKQAGFGIVSIVIIIVAVLVAALAGWAVYSRSDKTVDNAATTSTPATPAREPAATPSLQPADPATTEYRIPELGVKFKIPKSLRNQELTYQIRDIRLSNGGTAKAAYFSTKQLVKAEAKCAADSMSIAAMAVGDGEHAEVNEDTKRDYGPLLKQLSGMFVTFLTSRASCTAGKEPALEKQLSDTVADLTEAVKSVELAN